MFACHITDKKQFNSNKIECKYRYRIEVMLTSPNISIQNVSIYNRQLVNSPLIHDSELFNFHGDITLKFAFPLYAFIAH